MSSITKFTSVELDENQNEIPKSRKEYFLVLDEQTGIEIKCPTLEMANYAQKNNVTKNLHLSASKLPDSLES